MTRSQVRVLPGVRAVTSRCAELRCVFTLPRTVLEMMGTEVARHRAKWRTRRGAVTVLTCVVVFVAGAVVPAGAERLSAHASPRATPHLSAAGKIKHVIVIYQENRSFDEVLGAYCVQHKRCNGSI